MAIKIESAYLNADQEQKVTNAANLVEKHGVDVPFDGAQVPKEHGTIRVMYEVNAGLYLLAQKGVVLSKEELRIVDEFYKVMAHEIHQITTGTQKFVAEKDEATQV